MPNPFNVSAPISNATYDPLQGHDVDVFALDQGTGKYLLIGRFVSIQILIMNSTEPYLTLGQRMPRYLDGEMKIAWQMERGQLDSRVLQQTFGYSDMNPSLHIGRMPRLQITFLMSSAGLTNEDGNNPYLRNQTGEIILSFCKVETLTIGAMSGKNIVGNRWEGLAEGITFLNRPNGYNYSKESRLGTGGDTDGSKIIRGTTNAPVALAAAFGARNELDPFNFKSTQK
jgi:hypothetical protein